MERRRYVQSLTVGLATLVAGCSGGEPGSGPTETATPRTTRGEPDGMPTEGPTPSARPRLGEIPEAPVATSMTGWERRDYHAAGDRLESARDPPSVDFDPENDQLHVRGVVLVGSSSCNEAAVHEIEYDDGELHVYVLPDWKDSVREETPRECSADMSADDYEVEVTFDEGLPERVVVEEGDAEGRERRTVYER